MSKKLLLKLGFSLLLLTVMVVGFASTSTAQLQVYTGPGGDCPTTACPPTSPDHTSIGNCTIIQDHCVGHCTKRQNNSTGAICYSNCNWE